MRRRWLVLAGIVTAASGCDNVAWGGIDVRLEAPPPRAAVAGPTESEEGEDEVSETPLPDGPVLLAGTRDGASATLVVVGEIDGDGLRPLPSADQAPGFAARFARERLAPGTEFVLFAEGVRVGRLVVEEPADAGRFCGTHPAVRGAVELVPGAMNVTRVLALPADAVSALPYRPYRALEHDYDQRVASLALASEAIPELGAQWPPSLLESRADIQVFRPEGSQGAAIAATFLLNDRLSVGPPERGSWALFFVGAPGPRGITRSFTWYRPVETEGKGAPRYFGHLDWNRDGTSEVLLDVFGSDARWFAALARRSGRWVRSYQDPCGARGATPG